MFLRSEGAKARSLASKLFAKKDDYAMRVGGEATKISFSARKVLDFQGLSLFLQLKIPYHPIRVFLCKAPSLTLGALLLINCALH
jgi:hypothetical protein